jgi:hypothetical protein
VKYHFCCASVIKSEKVWQICKGFEYDIWSESTSCFSSYEKTQYSKEFWWKLVKPTVVEIPSPRDPLLLLPLFYFCQEITEVQILFILNMLDIIPNLCTIVIFITVDCLCGLVVRVSGYRSRGPGFYSRCFQIFWEAVGLEWGPLSLMRTTEELLGRNSSGSGQENRD